MPRSKDGEGGGECLKKVFFAQGGEKSDGWSVGFDVTDKKKTESVVGAFSLLRASKMNLCMVTVLQECCPNP